MSKLVGQQKFVRTLKRGDVVRALRNFDPKGANVSMGDIGVVFEESDFYGDGAGPMVRWTRLDYSECYYPGDQPPVDGGGACNVYDGVVEKVSK